ncbi:MAG: glycerol-3-phosphate 1-O-acyltransferase PlsY [Eubacteriales bacterium]|nr:glycerol-3-phosphate 1-O-acyltransferase PlsY [Eubacteriales bacterium]
MKLILIIVLGYLIGSVPFALVIGKVFFHKDIRQYGSGNLGGSNAGRVLGKRAGLATMALDLLKVTLVVLIAARIGGDDTVIALGALAAILGHCYPLFAQFHGGKAVASMYGMLFGLVVFAGRSPLYFFLPLLVFIIVLFLGRMSSLSSMLSTIAVTIFIWLQPAESLSIKVVQLIIAILIVYRHRANIERIRNHNENTVSWIPKL